MWYLFMHRACALISANVGQNSKNYETCASNSKQAVTVHLTNGLDPVLERAQKLGPRQSQSQSQRESVFSVGYGFNAPVCTCALPLTSADKGF